jgi:replicative DNA helicase
MSRTADVNQVAGLIDAEAEPIVLGTILREGAAAFHAVAETGLTAEGFGIGKHAYIYRVAGELVAAGREPSIGEMADELRIRGEIGQVDGISGLLALEEKSKAIRGRLVIGFAQTVRRNALHRRAHGLHKAMGPVIESAGNPEEICRLAGEIQNVYADLERKAHGETFAECLAEVGGFDALLSEPKGLVPFPFDGPLPGMAPGQLITIGGRSSMGKTVMGCHVALHAAGRGFRSLLISLEMGTGEMLRRLIAMVGKVNHCDLQGGNLHSSQRVAVNRAAQQLEDWRLGIVTEPNTLEGIAAKIAKARRDGQPYQLVVIDYLGLIQTGERFENRTAEVSHISRTLKRLAMMNEVPIVALAQLNRAPESRMDHEPQLSDLRDSGSIEQDSDIVGFVHRPGYYKPNDPELRNVAQLIFRKHRNGPIGKIDLIFLPEYVSFAEQTERRFAA